MAPEWWSPDNLGPQGQPFQPPTPQTLFGRLAAGRTVGKKINILLQQDLTVDGTSVNMFELKGADEDAQNLHLCIQPPRVKPIGGTGQLTQAEAIAAVQQQNVSGTYLNSSADIANQVFTWTPVIATLEWGVGGVSNGEVEVDISNGLNVNLSASFLRIGASFDPLALLFDGLAGTQAIYELGAFVGPGWAKPTSAQRTIPMPAVPPLGGANNGSSPIYAIPRYAKSLRMVNAWQLAVPGLPIPGWICQVLFYSNIGTNTLNTINPDPIGNQCLPVGAATIADNGALDSIPIPNGAYYFSIFNQTSGVTLQPTVIVDLAI